MLTKPTGMGTEANLLYEVLKKLDQLNRIAAPSGNVGLTDTQLRATALPISSTVIGSSTDVKSTAIDATAATEIALLKGIISVLLSVTNTGVAQGRGVVTPNDGANLPAPGWIEVLGTAGDVKVDPVIGTAGQIIAMSPNGTCTKFMVKRVYATGTTATSIVVYY